MATEQDALLYTTQNVLEATDFLIGPKANGAGMKVPGSALVRNNAAGNTLIGIPNEVSGYGAKVTIFWDNSLQQGITLRANSGTFVGNPLIFVNASNTTSGSISQSATSVSYNTSSDYRLKKIDGPLLTSGAFIDALNPVTGSWILDGSPFVGFLAHEVQSAAVTRIATSEKDGDVMQAMDYSSPEIIANIVAELKSLRARVAALEA